MQQPEISIHPLIGRLRTYLHEMITSQMKEKTVLLITHHYEELDGFDKIYRLENGYLFPVK